MPPSAATMQLQILISVLQSGNTMQTLLGQINQVMAALAKLQQQVGKTPPLTPPGPPVPPGIPPKAKEAENAVNKLTDAFNKLHRTMQLAAGGFLAFESVRFIKSLADAAARTEVLQTVMHQVGNNAGISTAKLDQMDKAVQKLGITSSAARESITRAIQADIPLDAIQKLARGAQDTAVILGTDSSTAFDRLVTAIQTQNTMVLRNMGIIIQAQTAYERYAQSIGKSASQLTVYQRTIAFTNAALKELTKLEGTYEAAMGDTGKQLTTLTRLNQTLKEQVGSALLPAYSALVLELTDVLKYMGLVSEGMMYQTQASRELGETVKNVAQALGDLAKMLIAQRDYVLAAVEGYFIFKVVKFLIADLITLFLRFAVGIEASALAGTGLVAALGGWVTIIVGLIAVLLVLMVQFPRFREGVYGLSLTLWGAIKIIWGVIEAFLRLVVVLDQMIDNLSHPFTADWKTPWTNWADWIKGKFKEVTDDADEANKHWQKALTPPKPEDVAAVDIREANLHLIELYEKRLDLVEKLNAAKKKGAGGEEDAVKLAEDLKTLDADQVATLEKRNKAYVAGGYSLVKQIDDQAKLDDAIKRRQSRLEMQGVEQARQGAEFTYTGEGEEKGAAFDKQLTDFNSFLDNYIKKNAPISPEEIRRQLIDAGKVAKTALDLRNMADAVKRFRAQREVEQKTGVVGGSGEFPISAKDITDAEEALRSARLSKERADISETSEIFQRRQVLRQQEQERQTSYLQFQLNQVKTFQGLTQAAEDYAFDRGRLSVDEYYNRRAARITAAGKLEAEAAAAAVTKAQLLPHRDAAERTVRDTAILAAQQAEFQQATEQQGKLDQNNLDRTKAQIGLAKQVLDLRLDTSASAGDEAAALAQIDEKYVQLARTLKASADAEKLSADDAKVLAAQEAIVNARLQERLKLQEEFNQKRFEADVAREQDARKELDLTKARRDTQRADIARRVEGGGLTDIGAIRERNALTRQDIEDSTRRLASLQRELVRIQRQQADAPAALRNKLAAQAKADQARGLLGISPEEINRQVQELERNLHGMAVGVQTEMEGVTASVSKMLSSLESYGKELRQAFQSALEDLFTSSLVDVFFKRWKGLLQSLESFAESILRSIASKIAKHLAQKITDAIVKATGGEGHSIFDKIFTFLGLKAEVSPGTDAVHPIYAQITNWPAGQPGVTQNISAPTLINAAAAQFGEFGARLGGAASLGVGLFNLFTQNLFNRRQPNLGTGQGLPFSMPLSLAPGFGFGLKEGGPVSGPGTGTSDSIPAMLSAGEHIMPADKAAQWLPLLEGIRTGKILPFRTGGVVQSIAIASLIPRHYAGGGVVSDAGASAVQLGGGPGSMVVSLHPDALNMTMRDWLEHEVVRQQGRR